MSRGENLQEMEVGTTQSKTAVNAGAKAGDPMPSAGSNAAGVTTPGQTGSWEDLGGPTPENYKTDDDSSKLKEPSLKTVSDVVNKGAKPAEPMQKMKEDEDLEDEEVISEEEVSEEETSEEISEEETTEEEYEVIENYTTVEEDVNALLSGEELSEEFKDKAKTIFEAALKSKVSEIKEALEVQYEERFAEEIESAKSELSERVDAYLEYVSQEWFADNKLAIEHGIKTEMTESFLSGMRSLFEDHYVSIPEDKYDVLESMVEKLDDMETKLNEQIERNISLNKRLAEAVADTVFEEISEGLASTQKEKLASLAESVEFDCEEEYREKLKTLRESYFPNKVASSAAETETMSEESGIVSESYSNSMSAYLKTLSAFAKN